MEHPFLSEEEATTSMWGRSVAMAVEDIAREKQRIEETMALLLRETRAARRRKIWRIVAAIAIIAGLIWLLSVTGFRFFNFWWIFKLGGAAWLADKMVHTRREAARTLEEHGDPRAVGVLAVALRDGDPQVQRTAASALVKLLPKARASDTVFIAPDQMHALLDIAYQRDPTLKIALLQGLEQIGDERAISVVEDLQTDAVSAVRQRAEECLPFVRERVRRAQESATLLRASAANATVATDHLLRPASAAMNQETPAGELLRPVETHGTPDLTQHVGNGAEGTP